MAPPETGSLPAHLSTPTPLRTSWGGCKYWTAFLTPRLFDLKQYINRRTLPYPAVVCTPPLKQTHRAHQTPQCRGSCVCIFHSSGPHLPSQGVAAVLHRRYSFLVQKYSSCSHVKLYITSVATLIIRGLITLLEIKFFIIRLQRWTLFSGTSMNNIYY